VREEYAALSTPASSTFHHVAADAALSAKLQEELLYEQDAASAEGGQLPEWLEEFQNNGTWKIVDKAGNDEVSLERHFGGEK
jgi:complement component 1 Q subcomponent-binding protein